MKRPVATFAMKSQRLLRHIPYGWWIFERVMWPVFVRRWP